jgi:TetR/AcrR family transcriptional repressor of lmrAB and yxaGH operons
VAEGARDRMVDSAVKLLAMQGFQGTSFSSVLDDSGAPRGSIYHHFPGGKDELVLAAIERSGNRAAAIVDGFRGRPADEIVRAFVALWRGVLTISDFRAGCSVLGATVSASEPAIVDRAEEVFRSWESKLADVFETASIERSVAEDLGTLLIASCEGAVVICRAERSFTPLDRVERSLLRLVAASVAA